MYKTSLLFFSLPLSGGANGGGARGPAAPLTAVSYVWHPCAPSGEYIYIIFKIMQKLYIGNSLVGDELAIIIAHQLISDILAYFAADVLDRAPLEAEAPQRGFLQQCYKRYVL